MAVRLLIPAYAWSLMTLWGEEIKDVMRGERKSEQEPEEEVAEREGSGAALADAVAEAAEIASGEIASGEIASPREMQAEVEAEMPSGEMTTETA